MNQNISRRSYALILVAVVLLLYTVTLKHGFVWDDHIYTVGNKAYQEFDIEKIFSSPANRVEYLPLRDLTYALDYFVWGESPFGFHLTNLILFILNILLIYLFSEELPFAGKSIELRRLTAFMTALLFAVHPLLSEAVNFITCRNVLLSGAAFFLAALVFVRYLNGQAGDPSLRVAIGLALCFIAALLSKATTIILPLVLVILAITIPSNRTARQNQLILTPLFLIAGLSFKLFQNVASHSRIIDGQLNSPLSEKMAIALQIPFFYLQKLLVPFGYSAEYAFDKFSENLASSAPMLSFLGLTGLAVASFKLRRKMPFFCFAFLWYGVTLLPVLNFFATNPIVADRYAYLPSFALVFLVATLLTQIQKRNPKTIAAVIVVLSAVLGGLTFSRSLDWRSDITLWQANIRTEPANAKGYQNLVAEAIISGDIPTAEKILNEGRSKASSPTYDYLEGMIHYRQQNLPMALKAFESALRQDKNDIRSLLNLGIIYQEMGNYDKASEYLRRTLDANTPDGWGCREEAQKRLDSITAFPMNNR